MSLDLESFDPILRLAIREGLVDEQSIQALVAAFRERADLILAERIVPLEDRLRALYGEVAWRKEATERLEEEVAWRQGNTEYLEGQVRLLQGQIRGLAQELERVARKLPWRPLRMRRGLRELAEGLRKGLP